MLGLPPPLLCNGGCQMSPRPPFPVVMNQRLSQFDARGRDPVWRVNRPGWSRPGRSCPREVEHRWRYNVETTPCCECRRDPSGDESGRGNPAGRDLAWTLIRARWRDLEKKRSGFRRHEPHRRRAWRVLRRVARAGDPGILLRVVAGLAERTLHRPWSGSARASCSRRPSERIWNSGPRMSRAAGGLAPAMHRSDCGSGFAKEDAPAGTELHLAMTL